MLRRRKSIAQALLGVLTVASVAISPLLAAAEGAGAHGDHKPGIASEGVMLPADLTMTVDGKKVPHPCAGRKLLYQAHVDAVYLSRSKGKLSIMTVDGSEVGESDKYCMRLAPDAYQGREVSRMVVPNDPVLSFLGAPGRIVWVGPAVAEEWRPIWAGLGAFDPAHEYQVPTDFVGDNVQFTLQDFSGPGDMEIFAYGQGAASAERMISSRGIDTTNFGVGGHAHLNWTFTEAGIYSTTWVGQGQHFDGTVEKTDPTTQYWLVGPDEAVGLPPGTTTKLNSIDVSAEQMRDSMGLKEPANPAPVEPAPEADRKQASKEQIEEGFADIGVEKPASITVNSGINWLKFPKSLKDELWSLQTVKDDGSYTYPGGPIVELPDAGTLRCVSPKDPYLGSYAASAGAGWMWVSPAYGDANTPSLGADLRETDMTQLGKQKVMMDFTFNGPTGSQFVVGLPSGDGLMPLVTSQGGKSKRVQMLDGKNYPLQFAFSHPGIYALAADISAYLSDGTNSPSFKTIYFAVGNEAINHLRKASDPKAQLLPEGEKFTCDGRQLAGADNSGFPVPVKQPTDPQPTPNPSETPVPTPNPSETPSPGPTETPVPTPEPTETPVPTPSAEPTQTPTPAPSPEPTATPSPTPTPSPTQPAEPPKPALPPSQVAIIRALHDLWSQAMPNHVVVNGHMDLALAADSTTGTVTTFLKDGADPSNVIHRPSGSFAINVPNSTRAEALPALTKYAPDMEGKIYSLPLIQVKALPWVGFSTEGLDYRGLAAGSSVTITLEDYVGPGRMITGHTSVTNPLDVGVDSGNPSENIVYPAPAHDHQFFWFSKPGVYRANFVYHWTANDGASHQLPLVSYFLVGDEAIKIGREAVQTQTLPALPEPDPGNPGEPPAPEPGEPGEPPAPGPDEPGNPGDPGNPPPTSEPTNPVTPPAPKPDPNPVTPDPVNPSPSPTNPAVPDPGNSGDKPGTNPGTNPGEGGKQPGPAPAPGKPTPAPGNPAPAPVSPAPVSPAPPPATPGSVTAAVPASVAAAGSSSLTGTLPLAAPLASTLPGTPLENPTESPTADPSQTPAPLATGAPVEGAPMAQTQGNAPNAQMSAPPVWQQASWLSGFLLGIGIMSLIGGVTLLVVAQKKLRQQ